MRNRSTGTEWALALALAFALPACGGSSAGTAEAARLEQPSIAPQGEAMKPNPTPRIKLTFDGGEAVAKLHESPTSRDLLASLPLTLTWRDYAGTEKVSDLPRRLTTAGAPAGSDPSVGDLAYFAPWGNLAFYYKDFGYSSGLIILGRVEVGADQLARIDGEFTVRVERLD